jgi:DNA-3-methyladenine glycosylase
MKWFEGEKNFPFYSILFAGLIKKEIIMLTGYQKISDMEFYLRDAETLAQDLLGKVLVVQKAEQEPLAGIIVETEAYHQSDPGSHSFRGKTPRNAPMYQVGGTIYVYFIYGMYYCFNIVADKKDHGSAVLIRALEPLSGIETMQHNRKKHSLKDLTNGPGKLCQALGIDKTMNMLSMLDSELGIYQSPNSGIIEITKSPRIGLSQGQDAHLRFFIKGNKFVSKT